MKNVYSYECLKIMSNAFPILIFKKINIEIPSSTYRKVKASCCENNCNLDILSVFDGISVDQWNFGSHIYAHNWTCSYKEVGLCWMVSSLVIHRVNKHTLMTGLTSLHLCQSGGCIICSIHTGFNRNHGHSSWPQLYINYNVTNDDRFFNQSPMSKWS